MKHSQPPVERPAAVFDVLIGNGYVKYRDVIKLLEQDGWKLDRTIGSHLQYRHPTRLGTVTVPGGGKLNRDIPPGTLNSIFKQAGLK